MKRLLDWRVYFIWLMVLALGAGLTPTPAQAAGRQQIQVFAASSLTETVADLARNFAKAHPGATVVPTCAASSTLRLQVEQGASPDVFLSADFKNIAALGRGKFLVGSYLPFANNHMVIIIPANNPGKIKSIKDLARPNLSLVACSTEIPVGNYTLQVLQKLQASKQFGPRYQLNVQANFRSLEPNVKGIVTKVMTGDADAGICYASDVTPSVARRVKVIPIPAQYNVRATQYIAVVKDGSNRCLAQEFVKFTLSPMGQRILKCHGLLPVKPACAGK